MKIKRLLLILAVVSAMHVSAPWGAVKRWWNNRKSAKHVSPSHSSSADSSSPNTGPREVDAAQTREAGMRILTSPKPAKLSEQAWTQRKTRARKIVHDLDLEEMPNSSKAIPLEISGFKQPQ